MKIGIFSDHFFPEIGGIQDSVAELTREMGRRGHQVYIWAPRANPKDFHLAGLPEEEINLGDNVQIYRVPSVSIPTPTLQTCLALPVLSVHKKEMQECDVFHTHSFLGIGFNALRAAKRFNKPLIGTHHMVVVEYSDYVPGFLKSLYKKISLGYVIWYYNHCNRITIPSKTVFRKDADGLSVPYQVVSNPIDVHTFRPAQPEERKRLRAEFGFEGPVISCVGRLAKDKRDDIILRAFAIVVKRFPDAILAFGGHGSMELELRKLASELNISSNVRFLGFLTKPEVANLFRASDVYAIASISETQSMSMMQAFASGLPAVGVNWQAIPEYLDDERGFLFERDDYESMAKYLKILIENEKLRRKLGANAQSYAQQFSIESVADVWEKLYESVLKVRH